MKEEDLKMIGAKVPIEFADIFASYCRSEKFNQRKLFYHLMKWWLELPEPIQWLIYRGKFSEAHSQIAAVDDENAAASASEESKHKRNRRSSSKSA